MTYKRQGGASPRADPARIVPDHDGHAGRSQGRARSASGGPGCEATREIEAVFGLLRAKDVDEAREALKTASASAPRTGCSGTPQGNILWTSHANVPIRDPQRLRVGRRDLHRHLPCLVLPGDGTAEWNGYLAGRPRPLGEGPRGRLHRRPPTTIRIGDTLDNDPSNDTLPDGTPMYLACHFDIGFREGRIQKPHRGPRPTLHHRRSLGHPGRRALGDGRGARARRSSTRHRRGAEEKRDARARTPISPRSSPIRASTRPRSTRCASLLDAWGTVADYAAASGVNPDDNKPLAADGRHGHRGATRRRRRCIFNAWLVRLLEPHLRRRDSAHGHQGPQRVGKEQAPRRCSTWSRPIRRRSRPSTRRPATRALWDDIDTPEVESRHERMVRALLDALADLDKLAGPDLATYRWGAHHTVRFEALISVLRLARDPAGRTTRCSRTGFPRHGDWFSVDSSDYRLFAAGVAARLQLRRTGPSQRFVIEMDPAGPKAFNAHPRRQRVGREEPALPRRSRALAEEPDARGALPARRRDQRERDAHGRQGALSGYWEPAPRAWSRLRSSLAMLVKA